MRWHIKLPSQEGSNTRYGRRNRLAFRLGADPYRVAHFACETQSITAQYATTIREANGISSGPHQRLMQTLVLQS